MKNKLRGDSIRKFFFYILGLVSGVANGLFGSGGGVILVPMLEKSGIEVKKSHASSLAITLPLSIVSAIFYSLRGSFEFSDALPLIPFGLVGALMGGLLLKKISSVWLKRIFGILLIIAGGRLILR
ncbi:MAG TPA: sulfite exporter TauE/SafE family protein [Clostridia bacterium]|nr:sulfite exporter TauE/SafE family protein [Clostridia bacterium]